MRSSKSAISILFMVLLLGLAGCSSSGSKDERAKLSTESKEVMDSGQSGRSEESLTSTDRKPEQSANAVEVKVENQMVIYQAELELRVKKFDQTLQSLESKAKRYGGYIAESTVT